MINAVIEYNNDGCLVYAENFIGAYTRAKTINEALTKLPFEVQSYCKWLGIDCELSQDINITKKFFTDVPVCDADTEILFDSEALSVTKKEYNLLKNIVMKSANDVMTLYSSIPDKDKTTLLPRKTFYGDVPITANEMLSHMNCITYYYLMQVGVKGENNFPDLIINRETAFTSLEALDDYLMNPVVVGSFGEQWSLRKVLRRFIWHDRIHAKAMWRLATSIWGDSVQNPFYFIK